MERIKWLLAEVGGREGYQGREDIKEVCQGTIPRKGSKERFQGRNALCSIFPTELVRTVLKYAAELAFTV